MTDTHKQYISTYELAKLLGVSSVTVFKRIQKGTIKATKIGRSYAIPRSYVEEHFPEYKIQAPIEGEYLSVMEAAEILGVSRVAVFKQIQTGKIEARRIGRHYVIERSQIRVSAEEAPLTLTKDFYSIPEAAEILGKTRIAIFKQVQQGKIKAHQVGRHYVIAREDIPGAAPAGEDVSVKEEYISVAKAAEILGISRIAVFKKIQKGQLKAQKAGRSYVIAASALRLYRKEKEKKQ